MTLGMTLAADDAGMALLTPYKAGQILYPGGAPSARDRWRIAPHVHVRHGRPDHQARSSRSPTSTASTPMTSKQSVFLDPSWSSGRGLVATLINTLAAL